MQARPKTEFEERSGDRLVNEVILSSVFICSLETFGFVFLFKFFLKAGQGYSNAAFAGKTHTNEDGKLLSTTVLLFLNEFLCGSSTAEGSSYTFKGKALIEKMNYGSKQDMANIFLTVSS